jgi:hypothetical protein
MLATVTVDVASACEVLNLTGNGGTLAFGTQILTVGASSTGAVTLGGTTSGTTGGIKITGASTLTGNSLTFNGSMNLDVAGIVKVSGSWINAGLTTWTLATNLEYNSSSAETYTAQGGITMLSQTGAASNATVYWTGGTFSCASSNNYFYNPLVINPTFGNITLATNSYLNYYNSSVALTYINALPHTVTTTGGTLFITKGSCATDDGTGHIVWDKVSIGNGSNTTAFTTNFWCNTFSMSTASTSLVSLTQTAGTTLTVNSALTMMGGGNGITNTFKSSSTSAANLNYLGTTANLNVAGMIFTWINASGSASTIFNLGGGTLSNTTNITNVNGSNINAASVCTGANNPGY